MRNNCMCKDNRELELIAFNFISSKIRIKIIGGGVGASIKAETFCKNGCIVEMLAKEFSDKILELKPLGIGLIQGEYKREFIINGHIIVIAIDDENMCRNIINDCEELNKIYIDCTNFRRGMGVVPSQRQLENLSFSLSTKVGVPRLSKMLSDKTYNLLCKYDNFVCFVSQIRDNAKGEENKSEIINFICNDDFKYFYDKHKAIEILQLYYGDELTKRLLHNVVLDSLY